MCWRYLSSRAVTRQVLSAQMSLTSVFGMGTGGPSLQSTPTIQFWRLSPSNFYILTHNFRFVKNYFSKFQTFLAEDLKRKATCFHKWLWLPLLDLLFCGKATAVATVHRTVAKSRLSSPTNKVSKKRPIKNAILLDGVFHWLPLLDLNQRPAD